MSLDGECIRRGPEDPREVLRPCPPRIGFPFGLAVAGLWMMFGYFLAGALLSGSWEAAAAGIVFNAFQAGTSLAGAGALLAALRAALRGAAPRRRPSGN